LPATAVPTAETTTAVAAAEAMGVVKMTIVAETATTTTFTPPPPIPTVHPSPWWIHPHRPSPTLPVGGGRAARGGDGDDQDNVVVLPRWKLDAGNANAHETDAVVGGLVIDTLNPFLIYYIHYDFYLH